MKKNIIKILKYINPIKILKYIRKALLLKIIIGVIFTLFVRLIIVSFYQVNVLESSMLCLAIFILNFTYEDLYSKIFIPKWLYDIIYKFLRNLSSQNIKYMNEIVNFMEGDGPQSKIPDIDKPSGSNISTTTEKYKMQASDLSHDEIKKHCPDLFNNIDSKMDEINVSVNKLRENTNNFLNLYRERLSVSPDNLFSGIRQPDAESVLNKYKKSEDLSPRKFRSLLDRVSHDRLVSSEAESRKLDLIYENIYPSLRKNFDKRVLNIKFNHAKEAYNSELHKIRGCDRSINSSYESAYKIIREIKTK